MTDQPATDRPVHRRIWIFLTATLAGTTLLYAQDASPPIPIPDRQQPTYPVVRVTDDCTVSLRFDDKTRRIALAGVTVPKTETIRQQLRTFLENLLKAEHVFVHYDPDAAEKAGNPKPAHLFRAPDGLFVNLELVRQGYAKVQTKPPCQHLRLLRHYEQRAREAGKGVWAPGSQSARTAESSAETAQPADADEITVYVTKSGKKYHREGCQYLSKSSRAIALREAVAKGYGPCSRCKPPTREAP